MTNAQRAQADRRPARGHREGDAALAQSGDRPHGTGRQPVVRPDLSLVDEVLIPEAAARKAAARFSAEGVDLWVFSPRGRARPRRAWRRGRDGARGRPPHAVRPGGCGARATSTRAISSPASPGSWTSRWPRWRCSATWRTTRRWLSPIARHQRRGTRQPSTYRSIASANPSASFVAVYLDVTPPHVDKGHFVARLAGELDIPLAQVAVLGDIPSTEHVPLDRLREPFRLVRRRHAGRRPLHRLAGAPWDRRERPRVRAAVALAANPECLDPIGCRSVQREILVEQGPEFSSFPPGNPRSACNKRKTSATRLIYSPASGMSDRRR
jgi:hypothetical protein